MYRLNIATHCTLAHLESAAGHVNHVKLHAIGGVCLERIAVDDDIIYQNHISGVYVIVAVHIGGLTGDTAGIALLNVAVNSYNIGGVDIVITVNIRATGILCPCGGRS